MELPTLCHTPQSALTLSAELRKVIHERNILTTRTRMKVLSELEDLNKTSGDRQAVLRSKAVQEILTSEVSYLHQLELLMQYFMEPLKNMSCISPGEYTTLFGHICTIYKVNGELLKEMKLNPDNVGAAFLKLAPFFKLYSVYAYDYKNVLNILQDLQKTNQQLNEFIQQQEALQEVCTKLAALLITPIQRVPRYRLLLREVLSLTPPGHPDFAVLQGSLREVESAASHINRLVAEQENMQRMVQLQRSMQGGRPSFVAPGRRLLKEGTLMKVSPQGGRAHSRYFVLFSDMLMYCKQLRAAPLQPSQPLALRCCCLLPLKKCRVDEVLTGGVFKLSCHGEVFLLYSTRPEETDDWVKALQAAVKQYHESRQTLRKDSSSRRPMRWADLTPVCAASEPLNDRRCRKRRHSDEKPDSDNLDSGGEVDSISGTPRKPAEDTSFLQRLWRRSVQGNPLKIQKLELDQDADAPQQQMGGTQDSLFPMRDTLRRQLLVQMTQRGNGQVAGAEPTQEQEQAGAGGSRAGPAAPDTNTGGFGVGRLRTLLFTLGRSLRKHLFRRVPRVPVFE